MTTDHQQVDDLLGAYALDALPTEEKKLVDEHLSECASCRAEVLEHQDTMAAFGPTEPVPEGLWSRITKSIEIAPPVLDLARVAPISRGRHTVLRVGAAAGSAAVLLAGFLAYRVVQLDRRLNGFATEQVLERAAMEAQTDPDSEHVQLESTKESSVVGSLALEPDGDGYLVVSELRELPSGSSYQLWSLRRREGDDPFKISLAVLGKKPTVAAFRMSGRVDGFAITEEAASGAATTSKQPTAIGWINRR